LSEATAPAILAWGLFSVVELCDWTPKKMPVRRPEIPNHNERQILQRLAGYGWVKADTLQSTPGFVEKLLAKGWIEARMIEGRLCYRATDQGLAAKKLPI
jgi:hypothetical protein